MRELEGGVPALVFSQKAAKNVEAQGGPVDNAAERQDLKSLHKKLNKPIEI